MHVELSCKIWLLHICDNYCNTNNKIFLMESTACNFQLVSIQIKFKFENEIGCRFSWTSSWIWGISSEHN